MKPTPALTGNHNFSKHDCPACGPSTLHKHWICIHCGRKADCAPIEVYRQLTQIERRHLMKNLAAKGVDRRRNRLILRKPCPSESKANPSANSSHALSRTSASAASFPS